MRSFVTGLRLDLQIYHTQVVNTALRFSVTNVLMLRMGVLEGRSLLQNSDVRLWLQRGVEDWGKGQPLSWTGRAEIGGFVHIYRRLR